MSDFVQELRDSINKIENIKKVYKDKCLQVYNNALLIFFQETNAQAIAWKQYTPYFNDGDICEFTLGEILLIKEGWDYEEDGMPDEESEECKFFGYNKPAQYYYDNYDRDIYNKKLVNSYKNTPEITKELCKILVHFMNDNEDLLKEIYGDHVSVAIYFKDGKVESIIEEYNHE